MKISIINTTSNVYTDKNFEKYHDYEIINTTELEIKFCAGCFGCWVKTPGECVQKDDMPSVLKSIINSDLVVYISEIKVGFLSSELKKINDKTIPLIHPYMTIFKDEIHHKPRYDKYPEIGLVLIQKEKISDEVFDIITNCFSRYAYNMRKELSFSIKDDKTLGGLKHEISNY